MPNLLAQVGDNFNGRYERLVDWADGMLPEFVSAAIVLVVFWALYRVTRRMLHAALRRAKIEPVLARLLVDNIYQFGLMAFGVVMAADQLGFNIAAALAGLGVIGIAVGFAAQDTLSNIIAGFLILWDKPFHVRDWITIEQNYGEVVEITLRTTRVRTLDNTFVVVPNKTVLNATLVNHSKNGETRVNIPLSIAYKEDIKAARRALLDGLASVEHVLDDPAPTVVVDTLGDSGVHLTVFAWIQDARLEKEVFFAGLESAKNALDEAGIQIPFPHMQLFLEGIRNQPEDVLRRTLSPPGQ